MKSEYNFDDLNFNPIIHGAIIPPMRIKLLLASGENNLHESGEINQKKSKEKSHYQF